MKRKVNYRKTSIKPLQTWEGEPIEIKVERILTQQEPITDGAPIIYTEKKEGVKPEHNIRTDRWEIAAESMNVVHKSKAAKVEDKNKGKTEPKSDDKKTGGTDTSETK